MKCANVLIKNYISAQLVRQKGRFVPKNARAGRISNLVRGMCSSFLKVAYKIVAYKKKKLFWLTFPLLALFLKP